MIRYSAGRPLSFLPVLMFVIGLAWLLGLPSLPTAPEPENVQVTGQAPTQPNILVIYTDDQRQDTMCPSNDPNYTEPCESTDGAPMPTMMGGL
ncbi:MAG: hypothetical protein ACRDIB_00345 [Ardenticatenaceae bacterium]